MYVGNTKNIEECIKYIETKYDVASIKYNDIPLWPFLRSPVFQCYFFPPSVVEKRSRQLKSLSGKINAFYKACTHTYFPFLLPKNKVLDFTDLLEFRFADGIVIDKIAKGVIDIEKDIVPVMIRNCDLNSFKKKIDQDFLFAGAKIFKRRMDDSKFSGLQTIKDILVELNIEFDFYRTVEQILSNIRFYQFWFKFIQPKKIYIACYYNVNRMAMIYVAKKMHIPTIELDHGAHTKNHYAYTSFVSIDDNPYPDFFFCFGSAFKAMVSPSIYKQNQIKIVGSYYLDYIRNKDCKTVFDQKYANLIKNKRIIVVASYIGGDEELLSFFTQFASLSDDFYVVFCPRKVEAYHYAYNHTNVSVETELDTYHCMKNAHILASGGSTCALEALSLGIPSLFINLFDIAKKNYGDLLPENDFVKYAESPKEALEKAYMLLQVNIEELKQVGSSFFSSGHKELIAKAIKECENEYKDVL